MPRETKTTRGFFLCTPENPWHKLIPGPVRHREAREVGNQRDGWPGGDIQPMRCDTCGKVWEMELPQ